MSTHQGEYIAALPTSKTMAVDTLVVMLKQEHTTYSRRDYLDAANFDAYDFCMIEDTHPDNCCEDTDSCITVHPQGCRHGDMESRISPEDRTKMVDWCFDIVDQCEFSRETVAVAMDIVDRFSSLPSPGSGCGNPQECQVQHMVEDVLHSRCKYQLLSLTALYISIKVHERVLISSRAMSEMSSGMYTTKEIEKMEMMILRNLQWRLCSPTALQVGYQVLELMEEWIAMPPGRTSQRSKASPEALRFIREELAFQTEIAVRDYCLVVRRASTVAVASLLNAIKQVNGEGRELLRKALLCVVQRFDFEEPKILLQVMDSLKVLLEENEENEEDDDYDASTVSTLSSNHDVVV